MSNSYFLKSGNRFTLTNKNNVQISDYLPLGTYSVNFDGNRGEFFFETIDDFSFKGKRYGDINQRADRVISTFADRAQNTGVLLNGEKGSGKTMLAKVISEKLREEHGISTLVVNTAFHGELFNNFIASISQPVAVIFDEFEKVYDTDKQEDLLTLFDGTRGSKKLFIVTANEGFGVSKYMYNRPGRLYYMFDYNGLDEGFITEYCKDQLVNKNAQTIRDIVVFSRSFRAFNFDMLKALIEELNRYGESVEDAVNFLNIKPTGTSGEFKVAWSSLEDTEEYQGFKWAPIIGINPYSERFYLQGHRNLGNAVGEGFSSTVNDILATKKYDPKTVSAVDGYVSPSDVTEITEEGALIITTNALRIGRDHPMITLRVEPVVREKKKYSRMKDFGYVDTDGGW